MLLIFETERDRAWTGEGQRERGGDTESEAGSRLQAVSTESDTGIKPMSCEIMTWAKVGRLVDWATQVPWTTGFIKMAVL